MKKRDLTKGNVTAVMLLFAVPMILGNIMQQCYNLADTWIVGRFVGAEALAAVGSAYTLMTFLNSILIGMCMGSGALFSNLLWPKSVKKLKRIYCFIVCAYFFSDSDFDDCFHTVCLDPILTLMQIPADIYGLMRSYMGLILAGLIFVFLYNYFAFLLRSSGNSVIPLIFLGVGTALNIGLDFFFVAKLGRGVKGAAEATVLAQAAAGLGIALYALVKEPELNMKKMKEEGIGIRADLLKEIFSYSASTGIQQSVMNFGILMVQGLVNSFGTSVMAAFAAGVKIDTLAYMPAQEFGNAYSIFISQNYGADKKERIRKGTKSAAVTVIMFCAAASAAVFFGAEFLMGILLIRRKHRSFRSEQGI